MTPKATHPGTPKIPKGWRRVRTGAKPRPGDRFDTIIGSEGATKFGRPVDIDDCDEPVMADEICIRRIPSPSKGKRRTARGEGKA